MSALHKLNKGLWVLLAADRRWLRALRLGVAPSLEHLRVLRMMNVETVVDIGANRGQFALAARRMFPNARIESFEPLPGPAALYQRVFEGDGCARLHECAIAPEPGTTEIHISARDDSSSLLPITDLQSRLFPGTAEAGRQVIRLSRLIDELPPDVLSTPALLKLDVQGFELQALAGCEALLDRFAWVYVECSFVELYKGQALADEVVDFLHSHRFALRGVYNLFYDTSGKAVQGDFLFERK